MKKIICLFVLILGFIGENKAQFAPSSEIYYYLCVANTGGAVVDTPHIVKFYNNAVRYKPMYGEFNEENLNEAIRGFKNYPFFKYDIEESTSKYVAYSMKLEQSSNWVFFSKDKSEMIEVSYYPEKNGLPPLTIKRYYKRVTKQDLINKNKPNFDFLE